jgi:ubiquinone/menaquinone biosynthesis C-methylase UbiE
LIDAKTYFSSYLADDVIRPLNHQLVDRILKYKPKSVFEFGCGQGKNLDLIKQKTKWTIQVSGIDLSQIAVEQARNKDRGHYVKMGDENTLRYIQTEDCDVSFTCSVLDHIEQDVVVRDIVENLKRISKKAVILLETERHTPSTYYYYHCYPDYGFKKIRGWEYYSSPMEGGDGSIYYMYKWERRGKEDWEKKKKNKKKKSK